jgi:hypothetical protein
LNLKNDWTIIVPAVSAFVPVISDILEGSVLKFAKEFAWNSPFWILTYAIILGVGVGGSLVVSFWRRDFLRYLITMLCSFAAFILTILEKGLGQMWWNLLSTGLPFGLGYVILFAFAAIMLGGFFYLHYTVIRLPMRVEPTGKVPNLKFSYIA